MVKRRLERFLWGSAAVVLVGLFLVFEELLAESAWSALTLSATRVVPVLFPYAVISSVIISRELFSPFYPKKLTVQIFGLPPSASSAVLCGFLCGFPVGAICASKLCESGQLTPRQGARLTALSSVASPAFLIGTVGSASGSSGFGVFLMAAQTVIAILVAAVDRRLCGDSSSGTGSGEEMPSRSLAEDICTAVGDSTHSCIIVVGYIVFFSVLASLVSLPFPELSFAVRAVLEFSSGSVQSAHLGGIVGSSAVGFSVGFCGICVLMQVYNYTSRAGIPFMPIFAAKLVSGVLLGLASAIYVRVLPLNPPEPVISAVTREDELYVLVSILLIFDVAVAVRIVRLKIFSREG